jgi:hypothetical protein
MKDGLAVAYAMKRRGKKYAKGGLVDPPAGSLDGERDLSASEDEALEAQGAGSPAKKPEQDEEMLHTSPDADNSVEFEEGLGSASDEASQPEDVDHPLSANEDIVEAIMHKRRMAKGGLVEDAGSQSEDVFEPSDSFSEHGQEGNLKENYASDLSDEDKDLSLVAQIMKDRKSKRR